ncbi:restriction endonuclease subunit S [Mycoplasma mycoides]|uniref:restriction endonuclease subunit S n=1 Tax=Mycoplasma mycoides TaxID=2102 RepID=UPI0027359448|nr:restriction endonuclease subunit S [Mycoplasma mycoides]MDP4041537.1 restriction endonuclease subunit S [Mycoplasma mycoides]MDP4058260.1 restriction endonuclease subunit S [Mycoplasma mycoides]
MNNEVGSLPATTAVVSNNQIGKYISPIGATILSNVFSATANGFGKAFYQPREFTVLQDSYAFTFKDKIIDPNDCYAFILGVLNKIYVKYNWSNKSGWNKIKNEYIKLPIKENKIDWTFIKQINAELEAQHIAELEAYLKVTGLKNFELTDEEQKAIREYDKVAGGGLNYTICSQSIMLEV